MAGTLLHLVPSMLAVVAVGLTCRSGKAKSRLFEIFTWRWALFVFVLGAARLVPARLLVSLPQGHGGRVASHLVGTFFWSFSNCAAGSVAESWAFVVSSRVMQAH